MQLLRRVRERRTVGAEPTELEMYRFWHLDYGEVAYYDQLVFKRHRPIPPERDSKNAPPRQRDRREPDRKA